MVWALAGVLVNVLLFGGEDLSLDEIVAAHESAVALIHSADVELEFRQGLTDDHQQNLRWSLDGDKERVRTEILLGEPTEPMRFSDWFIDGRKVFGLIGVDPKNPPRIDDPFENHTISGWTRPQTRNLMTMRVAPILLLKPGLMVNDEQRTLAELVHDARAAFGPQGAQLLGRADVGDRPTWKIRLLHPGIADEQTGAVRQRGSFMNIFVDPSVNYHIRRAESQVKAETPEGEYVAGLQAVSFYEFGDGVFLAQEVRGDVQMASGERMPMLEGRFVVTKAEVNQPLPSEALDFRFPRNLMVKELPPVNGSLRLHVMGDDNQIVQTINGSEELKQLLEARYHASERKAKGRRWSNALVGALPVVVIVAFILYRRRRRKYA